MSKRSTRTATDVEYTPARIRGSFSVGTCVRTCRELQEMTQLELANAAGLAQSTLSGIESDRIALGVERAKRLAIALNVHPAVLLFPGWGMETRESA